MNGKANRTKGHRWERKAVLTLKKCFPKVLTSRLGSLDMDRRGIDLLNTADLAIQCKAYSVKPNFKSELNKIDTDDIRILAWKNTRERGNESEFGILYWADLVKLLEKIYV